MRTKILILFILLLLLTISSVCLAGTLIFGLDSGVTAPLSANDNLHYNPSIYVQPSLFLRISENTLLSTSYGYVFARGGELMKETGTWGDVYGNYNTQLYFIKLGLNGEHDLVDLNGGFGIWSYRTDRDLVGEWTADWPPELSVRRTDFGGYIELVTDIGRQTVLKVELQAPHFSNLWLSIGLGVRLDPGW